MGATTQRDQLLNSIEATLAESFPSVELVDLDVHGGRSGRLTIYIDTPEGVDLGLCEAVARALDEVREKYALDVSSPGLDRPLRTLGHFERSVGERVYVKTTEPREGRSVFRGRLIRADAGGIGLALDEGGEVTISYHTIAKAHVIFEFDDNGGHRE